jgi:ABC-2 type transport system permease protein
MSKDTLQDFTPKTIGAVNFVGLKTLIWREVGRFLNVYTQTIVAPIITTLLFFAVFALAFGGIERLVGDTPYMEFLAPGLVMMTMVQNAFSNTSSSMVIAKVQGNIVYRADFILSGFLAPLRANTASWSAVTSPAP